MEPQIPLRSVVLFIACGTMLFVIVFIFAKRQITRFTLKSSRVPHATIGADAPKALRVEIERRLKRVAEIQHEPQLMSDYVENTVRSTFNGEPCHFIYRMKAVDALSELDVAFKEYSTSIHRNKMAGALRSFLLEQRQTGPLVGIKLDIIDKFCQKYDHARHDPADFTQEHYEEYRSLLYQLKQHIHNRKNISGGPKLSSSLDKPRRISPEGSSTPSVTEQQITQQTIHLHHLTPSPPNPRRRDSNLASQASDQASPTNESQDDIAFLADQEEVTFQPRKRKHSNAQPPETSEQRLSRDSEGSSSIEYGEEQALIQSGSQKMSLKGQGIGESSV